MGKTDIEITIDAMIAEQGEVWLGVLSDRSSSHNAVVVTDSPRYCYRLMFRNGQWEKLHDSLSDRELADFFAAFGSHWNILLFSWVDAGGGSRIPIRAFIANGRKPRSGFSISIDATRTLKVEAA